MVTSSSTGHRDKNKKGISEKELFEDPDFDICLLISCDPKVFHRLTTDYFSVQMYMYFLSYVLGKDFLFSYVYYAVASRAVLKRLKYFQATELVNPIKIRFINTPFRFLISEKGKEHLEKNFDQRRVSYIKSLTIVASNSASVLFRAVLLNKLMDKLGNEEVEPSILRGYLKYLGWETPIDEFASVQKLARRIRSKKEAIQYHSKAK